MYMSFGPAGLMIQTKHGSVCMSKNPTQRLETGYRAGMYSDMQAQLINTIRKVSDLKDYTLVDSPIDVNERIGTHSLIHSIVKQSMLTTWNLYVRIRLGQFNVPERIRWHKHLRSLVTALGYYLLLKKIKHPYIHFNRTLSGTRIHIPWKHINIRRNCKGSHWELVHLWNKEIRHKLTSKITT